METCEDVLNIYPGIYPTLQEKDYENTISHGSMDYWFVLEHTYDNFPATLKNKTVIYSKMESAITLKYSTEEEAQSGNGTPTYGEYSFRLFSQAPGPEVDFIPEVTDQGMSIYKSMVSYFEPDNKC